MASLIKKLLNNNLYKRVIFPLILVWALKLNAQTNNFYGNHLNSGFYFDNFGNLIELKFYDKITFSGFQLANFKGNPNLFSISDLDTSFVNKINFDLINNSNYFYKELNSPYKNITSYFDTNKIIAAHHLRDSALTYSILNYNQSIKDFEVKEEFKNIQLYFKDNIEHYYFCRNKNSVPILVLKTSSCFYSFKLNTINYQFELLDSMKYAKHSDIPDSIKYNPKYKSARSILTTCLKLSNDGSKIAFNEAPLFSYTLPNSFNLTAFYMAYSLKMMDFDKETGKFSNLKIIKLYQQRSMFSRRQEEIFGDFCFSPNDSMLYFAQSSKDSMRAWSHQDKVFQYNIFKENYKEIYSRSYSTNKDERNFDGRSFLNINHLGQLFFLTPLSNTHIGAKVNLIKNPNSNFNLLNIELNKWTIFNTQPLFYNFDKNYNLYDYLRTDHSITYDCKATVQIKNNSQSWIGFTDYKWHILNDKGKEEYYTTKEPPTLTYTKNGDYYIKLFGYSPRGKGYGEWYIDTIKVRIPPKPIANFYVKDSIVCRYTGLQFYNHSNAKDTIKNEYLWSFGDGNTSSAKNPMHTYSNPGVYTVTLHYKNGYCDSTLTKNQYIKVVDAPKPGFSVLYKQGCAPFVAHLKDTTTINVQQKDYYFSDTKLWQNVPVFQPNFTHTFNKPGVYKALQRLTGYTGCVIQTDSVVFNVSKGLTKTDTLNIINSTVQTKNALSYWSKIDGAVKYQLFKNNIPYKTTTDTFYYETIPYLKDASYTVAGIDSCGNLCSQGRQGKPVFLQGDMVGDNEAAAITFSPYLQWQGTNLVYKIQKLINGNWATINSQNTNTAFTDNNFLNKQDLQACYRIESYEISNPNIISHSNELCIPYIPTIFIPTAFSPNDDGINDVFDVVNFGLKSYTITVYNRWGEEIFKGQNNQAWDGVNCADGVYTVSINYTTNKGIKLHQRLTVTLIK